MNNDLRHDLKVVVTVELESAPRVCSSSRFQNKLPNRGLSSTGRILAQTACLPSNSDWENVPLLGSVVNGGSIHLESRIFNNPVEQTAVSAMYILTQYSGGGMDTRRILANCYLRHLVTSGRN